MNRHAVDSHVVKLVLLRCADCMFEKLLAVGLTVIVDVQAFIILAGVLRVLPLTGVTLPFMSYGGSSLVANYMLLALLIAVSHSSARRLHEVDA
jgi:cell division protein FtsW (lipid II flippase)